MHNKAGLLHKSNLKAISLSPQNPIKRGTLELAICINACDICFQKHNSVTKHFIPHLAHKHFTLGCYHLMTTEMSYGEVCAGKTAVNGPTFTHMAARVDHG